MDSYTILSLTLKALETVAKVVSARKRGKKEEFATYVGNQRDKRLTDLILNSNIIRSEAEQQIADGVEDLKRMLIAVLEATGVREDVPFSDEAIYLMMWFYESGDEDMFFLETTPPQLKTYTKGQGNRPGISMTHVLSMRMALKELEGSGFIEVKNATPRVKVIYNWTPSGFRCAARLANMKLEDPEKE